jgi:NADP-dependent 3-hydroxy acid dehydrogenase YdfG
MSAPVALVVGAGSGLSASLARLFRTQDIRVALAARNIDKLTALATEIGALSVACDATEPAQVEGLFREVAAKLGQPSIVVYNAGRRVRGAIETLDPTEVQRAWLATCFGGFLVGQHAARGMLAAGNGTILFTGATASVKAFAQSAAFAMGKFGLRALAQSMARELAPKNIHVAHIVIDGAIATNTEDRASNRFLDPNAIAREYLHLINQHPSAWTWEIELRPAHESF